MRSATTTGGVGTLQEWFQSESCIDPIIDSFYDSQLKYCYEENGLIARHSLQRITEQAKQNLFTALHYCESPIEKIFAVHLQIAALQVGHYGFRILPPPEHLGIHNTIGWLDKYARTRFKIAATKRLDPYGPERGPDFRNFDSSDIPHSISVFVQPEMMIGCGRRIRPDFIVCIPTNPECRIVVECDGYMYHSDRESFTNDRKRDRALYRLGWGVRRFSGSEIIATCAKKSAGETCAYELIEELLERYRCGRSWRREWEKSTRESTDGWMDLL